MIDQHHLIFVPQSSLGRRVSMTVLDAIAVSFTTFRLYARWRSSKMWLDDYLVFIPLVIDFYYMVTVWSIPIFLVGGTEGGFQVNFFIAMFPAIAVIWLPRSVLALGLARIFPERTTSRIIYLALAMIFIVICITSTVFFALECSFHNLGTKLRFPTCLQKQSNSIMPLPVFLGVDIASDLLLVVCPLYMLWHAKLLPVEKRMILLTLSCSLITCALVIVFTFFVYFSPAPSLILTFSHFEAAVSLIVCNLMVVVSNAFLAFRNWRQRRALLQAHPSRAPMPGIASDTDGTSHSSTYSSSGTPTPLSLTLISDWDEGSECSTGAESDSRIATV